MADENKDAYILDECQKMIDKLNSTKGINEKIRIMKEAYSHLQPLIKRVWDPVTTTGVTIKGINDYKKKDMANGTLYGLYELHDKLAERAISGDKAKAAIWTLIRTYPQHEELIKKIMEKNLRMRMGEKLIMQAFPGIFRVFEVALASDFDEKKFLEGLNEHSKVDPPAYISDKKDGVRLITIVWNGVPKFFSRTGQEFTSLGKLVEPVKRLVSKIDTSAGIVLDGEIITLDGTGKENFKLTVSCVRQKEKQMAAPIYHVFDMIPQSVFDDKQMSDILSERFARLKALFKDNKDPELNLLEQTPYSAQAFDILKEKAKKEGREGLIIRFNHVYEPKRSKNMVKYKFFETEEFKVVELGIEVMPFPNKNGGEDFKRAMKNAMILYKGDPVWVGSGFSAEERIKYAENPELLIGQLISVRYQEPFQDATTGKWSLRIPTFEGIVGTARDF